MTTEQSSTGVRVEGRTVGHPRSISAQARAFLESMVALDGIPLSAHAPAPSPDDRAAWMAYKAGVDASMGQMVVGVEAIVRSSVETIELGGVVVHVATPATDHPKDCAYLDFHGGGLFAGGGDFCRVGAQLRADQHGMVCYSVDYRMPPEHPYPAALDDCVAVYRALLERHDAGKLALGGASAGGNLAPATVLRARDEGLPLPAALVLLTPELDLTESGDTFETNRLIDVVLPLPLLSANRLYANGHELSDPYLSPLFGDFGRGFPPTFLQSGTRDLFLSNTVRMHRALLKAGIPVELHIFEGMPHGGFMGAPEDLELGEEIARFVRTHLGA